MSTTDLPGSSLLAGRYRLVERLGAGGMSVVWRGFDEVLGRQVAVKVLPPSTSTDPSFRRRLRAEAQAAARLSHPHITNVYDYGEATTVDGEPVPYVVMELIDGESLAAVLARVRRLPWQQAVRITAEVAAALAAAHSRGIVHRDVTPANVMLTPTGAKVVDFGISALIGENDIDPDGSLLGTPAYLAPERLEGGQVSPATDVYAVGLLIYRTLIGQLPWDVGTTTALLRAHQYTEPDPLPPVEGLPAAVSALVGRCLEKRPDDRPSSAELAHVLAGISAGSPVVARGYTPDWSESGEDTTILPAVQSYAMPLPSDGNGPARNNRFGAADAAGGNPALRKAFGNQAPGAADAPAPSHRGGENGPKEPGSTATGRFRRAGTRRVLLTAGVIAALGAGTAIGLNLAGQPSKAADTSSAIPPQPTVVPASNACVVSYAVWSDTGSDFKAQIVVANRNDTALKNWKLDFIMPGDQTVSGQGKADYKQQDRGVTLYSAATVNAQSTITVPLFGRYATNNAAPQAFALNGEQCTAFVSGKPGEPVRQVQTLPDGRTTLGPTPTTTSPLPGISIAPNGTIKITPTTPPPAGGGGTVPTTTATTPGNGTTTGGGVPTTSTSPSPSTTTPSINPVVPSSDSTTPPITTSPTSEAPPAGPPGAATGDPCDSPYPEDCTAP